MTDAEPFPLPLDIGAEQAVLGALMLAPGHVDTVAARLSPDDFYRDDHRLIFRTIQDMHRRHLPMDAVTMADYFARQGLDDLAGGVAYVVELANMTPNAANLRAYVDIVRDHAERRRLIGQLERLTRDAYDATRPMTDIIGRANAELLALETHSDQYEHTMGEALRGGLDGARKAKAGNTGLLTGLRDLDRVLGGLRGGDVTTVAARPSMGKTAFMGNTMLHIAERNIPVGVLSTEQPFAQLGARALALRAKVDGQRIRNGSLTDAEFQKLYDVANDGYALPIIIHDQALIAIADVERIARRWKRDRDIGVLFVDYAQRIESSRTDRRAPKHEKVGEVMRSLKGIARDLDIPVVVLAQVSRAADDRPGGCPELADLADSSEIEKESDVIVTMHRPHDYDTKQPQGVAVLTIRKNRHGPTGQIEVAWTDTIMRFTDFAKC